MSHRIVHYVRSIKSHRPVCRLGQARYKTPILTEVTCTHCKRILKAEQAREWWGGMTRALR